jgi:hypothetical protein
MRMHTVPVSKMLCSLEYQMMDEVNNPEKKKRANEF